MLAVHEVMSEVMHEVMSEVMHEVHASNFISFVIGWALDEREYQEPWEKWGYWRHMGWISCD